MSIRPVSSRRALRADGGAREAAPPRRSRTFRPLPPCAALRFRPQKPRARGVQAPLGGLRLHAPVGKDQAHRTHGQGVELRQLALRGLHAQAQVDQVQLLDSGLSRVAT